MKTLSYHIITESFSDLLLDDVYKHIAIDLHNDYGYTLYDNAHVFERLGSFDNSGKIVMYIFENMIEQLNNVTDNNITIDCSHLNTFFNDIVITIYKKQTIEGEFYKRNNSTIFINLVIPEKLNPAKDWKPIMKILLHELLHAYEDYNRKDSIFNYFNAEYAKSFSFMKTSFIETNKKLFEFGYFYNNQERNAYFSNIYNDVKDVLTKLNMVKIEKFDYKKFLIELKNTDIWKTYFDIMNFIVNIDNLSDTEKNRIIQTFSFIKEKKLTFNQIKKELNNKLNKFYSKFNQLVPKCICDIIQVDNKKAPMK